MIRLGVYLLLLFTSYYIPSPPLWEVVANSMYFFWSAPQRPEGLHSQSSTYTASGINQSLRVPRLHMVNLVTEGTSGSTGI